MVTEGGANGKGLIYFNAFGGTTVPVNFVGIQAWEAPNGNGGCVYAGEMPVSGSDNSVLDKDVQSQVLALYGKINDPDSFSGSFQKAIDEAKRMAQEIAAKIANGETPTTEELQKYKTVCKALQVGIDAWKSDIQSAFPEPRTQEINNILTSLDNTKQKLQTLLDCGGSANYSSSKKSFRNLDFTFFDCNIALGEEAANEIFDIFENVQELIDPVKPLNALQKAWNVFLSNYHVNRAYDFASKNNIDEADIYETSYDFKDAKNGKFGTAQQVIVYQLKKDANGNNIELKHVFRQHKDGVFLLTSSDNDDLNLTWDNYWTEDGDLILNESDLSVPVTDITGFLPAGGASKVAAGVKLAGSASKTWSVYTFMTTTGRYYGMTVDYTRRLAQHGLRVLGQEDEMIKNIPDKLTARGIEQLFINFGVETKTITKQINSINPKRTERYNQAITQAKDFLRKNYPGQYLQLFE